MIGKTLAHYEITGLLGKGGMGEVYRARDLNLDREVALKLLPQEQSGDSTVSRRFEREAKVLAALKHPNIAAVYGFHEEEGQTFIAMELVSGQTLATGVAEGGLPLDRLLEIGIPLADAVAFAHQKGVVHRDLKPANIMQEENGWIRVLDFGLAGLGRPTTGLDTEDTVDALTTRGEIVGTIAYMAPEQIEGHAVDARADVFSLGVLLFELATGQRPFRGDSALGVASKILREEPTVLGSLRPDLPADLARLIRRCLEKKTERRLQTARDLCTELEDLRSGIRTVDAPAARVVPPDRDAITEGRLSITTDHVRRLAVRVPLMVGDTMTYLDNNRVSDVLVVCLHGIGSDQRDFEDLLRQGPYRMLALSLYGFGPSAAARTPLSITDHNRLVAYMVQELRSSLSPDIFILVGHSSGADQVLQIVVSDDGEALRPDGLVLLGPAVVPGEGRISGPYSHLTTDPAGVFAALRTISGYADNLDEWLITHDYLVRAFRKFGSDVSALRSFAQTYIASLEADSFFVAFGEAVQRSGHVRCVFGKDDIRDADRALEQHISKNALGDEFSEEMITTASTGHIELKNASVVLPYLEEIVRLERERR